MKPAIRITLLVLNIFLALTAVGGGIGLLSGFGAPPVELIKDSIFQNYSVPGMALLIFVGGSASVSSILLIRKNKSALHSTLITAVMIIFFELIEIYSIGSPQGVARNLQILYFIIGIISGALALKSLNKKFGD